MQTLKQSRESVTIEEFDAYMWRDALATAGMRTTLGLKDGMPAMPKLPEPEFAWNDHSSYAQFNR